jgi:hypothetical protein
MNGRFAPEAAIHAGARFTEFLQTDKLLRITLSVGQHTPFGDEA